MDTSCKAHGSESVNANARERTRTHANARGGARRGPTRADYSLQQEISLLGADINDEVENGFTGWVGRGRITVRVHRR